MVFANVRREDELDKEIDNHIDRLAPKIRKVFQDQQKDLEKHLPGEITKTTIDPVLDKAFKATDNQFKNSILSETTRISQKAAAGFSDQVEAPMGFRFDYADPNQQKFLEDRAAKMVKKIDEVTRQDIHDIITKGHTEKKAYNQIAKEIREKYSEMAVPAGPSHIRDRAELIAVTDIAYAAQATSYAQSMALAQKGWIVHKFWNNTGDERVSDGCKANTSQGWIPIEQSFQSGHQYAPRFPGCRCAISYKVVGMDPNFKEESKAEVDSNQTDDPVVKVYQTKDTPPTDREDLSETQKETINEWVKDSTYINAASRYGRNAEEFKLHPEKFDEANRQKKILEGVIAAESLKQSYDVIRGLGQFDISRAKSALDTLSKGDSAELIDSGFTAVSFNERTPIDYANPDENGELWAYVSPLKNGDPALFIGNQNPSELGFRDEGEILINRNTKYYVLGETITGITDKYGTYRKMHLVEIKFEY